MFYFFLGGIAGFVIGTILVNEANNKAIKERDIYIDQLKRAIDEQSVVIRCYQAK